MKIIISCNLNLHCHLHRNNTNRLKHCAFVREHPEGAHLSKIADLIIVRLLVLWQL